MKLAESRGALRRNLGGIDATWTDELLDGAIARAVEDLDRIIPQEKLAGVDIIFDIDGEEWNSGTLGTAVTLANKRIRVHNETVKSSDGNTTYKRDTDYTIDYAAGKITALSTGAITESTDLQIDYKILEVYLDISSYADLIRVVRVEYPAGNVPSDFQTFYTWGDFVVVTARGRESQQRLTERSHAWVYYHAKHTLPEVDAEGSWKPQLDEVVIKGAESYSLMTKALELRHDAGIRLTSSLTVLGQIGDIETEIDTALTNTATQATSASADLDNIQARIDDMLATLASAGGFLASAGASIVSALAQAAQAESDISAIDSPLVTAIGKLVTVDSLVTGANILIGNVKTFVAGAQLSFHQARGELGVARTALDSSVSRIDRVDSSRALVASRLLHADARVDSAMFYHGTKPSTLMVTIAQNINNIVAGVTLNVLSAREQLSIGLAKLDKVNIGEQVGEMYRRYADTYLATARMEYDEYLIALGHVDRVLAQGTGLVAEASELRGQADTWLNEGNLLIAQMTTLLNQVRGYQENASKYVEAGRANIDSGQVSANAATAAVGLVGRGIEQANSYTSIARLRLDAASESSDLVQSYIAAAAQYIAMAEAKISEGNAKRTPIDAILERVTRKIEIARIFQQESDRRIQELSLKQQEADRYMSLALRETELGDKFEERGVLTKVEFMDILTDRAQVRSDTSLSPTRQQAPG